MVIGNVILCYIA